MEAEALSSFDANDDDADVTSPGFVGFSWLYAAQHLPDERDLFEALCLDPSDWKDHEVLSADLDTYGIASRVDPAIEAPDRIAFMRLVDGLSGPVRVWVGGTLPGTSMLVLTLVRHDSRWWVFCLGPDFIPAGRVFDDWSYRRQQLLDNDDQPKPK